MNITESDLIAEVTIPQYIRRIETAKARRATYYFEGEKLPKKYQKGLDEGTIHWMFIKERKGIVLVDAGGDPIIKNPRTAGTPSYKVIKGNDLHTLTMRDYERSKIVKAIKDQMIPEVEKLEPFPAIYFPIRLICEIHHPIDDPLVKSQNWDIDNHALWYCKVFPDVLSGCPYTKGKAGELEYLSKRIIPDDHRKYITQPPVPIFIPIENIEERKLVFKIYSDKRQVIISNEYYKEFQPIKEVVGLERHRYAPELNSLHYDDGTEERVPYCTTIEEAEKYLKNK